MKTETQTGNGRATAGASPRSGSKKREREILDAAAEIFHRQGYADTSVQDVADAVGILKGSLYYYIDSKEDLLFRVLTEVHEDSGEIIDEIGAMDAPPLERLYAYIRRHMAYNTRHLSKIAVYYHDFQLLSEDRRKAIVQKRRRYEQFVSGLIAEAQERGEVHESLDPGLVANAIFGTLNWIYTWYRPGGSASPEHLGVLYAELIVNGVTGAKLTEPAPEPVPSRRSAGARSRKASRSR